MRVVEVTSSPRVVGGAERLLAETAPRLRELGHEVHYAFLEAAGIAGGEQLEGDGAAHFPGLGVDGPVDWLSSRTSAAHRSALGDFGAWLRRLRPDVVHVGNVLFPALLAAIPWEIPAVRSVHDYRPLCPTLLRTLPGDRPCGAPMGSVCFRTGCLDARAPAGLLRWSFTRYERRRTRAFDRAIARSAWMARMLRAGGFADTQIELLPLTVPVPDDVPSYPEQPMLLFVGRLAPEKGPRAIVRLLRDLPEAVTATFAGAGTERPRILRDAKAFGVAPRVTVAGWQGADVIRDLYRRASVVVMPGTWPEPAGLVGLEALAMGRPVVATDAGGIREWLTDGERGRLLPPGDAKALAEAVGALVADPGAAAEMGANGHAYVRAKRSMDAGVAAYVDVLVRAVREHRA